MQNWNRLLFKYQEKSKEKNLRSKLLKSLPADINRSFSGTKLHWGALSPGCLLCGAGYWSCLFINRLCTRNCFYCPQDRQVTKEALPHAEQVTFKTARQYADYVFRMGYKGVGITGGEALLSLPKVLEHIEEIRKISGK